jgi:CubicO group peptidase (beta-lactamase class C family)
VTLNSVFRCALGVLAVAPSLFAQAARRDALAEDTRHRIDSVFADVDRTTSPGCALGIYRDGEIAYARGYGMANLEHGIAITPRSVFDIGSTSKQFTATSIVLLAQDGKLSIDDDIRKYIPEIPQYQRPITIRMLLNHTSGIRDYLTLMELRGVNVDGVTTDRDALDLIVRQKATNFEPGSEYLYSNSGYFLLSQIVKRVSGMTLARFARARIFEPLGMRETHIHDDHTLIVPLRATGYSPRDGGGFRIDMSGFEQTGDGAVMTTVEDLLKWDGNFYQPVVGGADLLRNLHTQGILNSGKTIPYALGLMVADYRGVRRVSHGGAWAGYRAELMRFPEQHTSVAVLCNLGTSAPSARAARIADILLAGQLASASADASPPGRRTDSVNSSPRPGLSALQLQEYAGQFVVPELDVVLTVAVDSTGLTIRPPAGDAAFFRPLTSESFSSDQGLSVVFTRGRDRRITGFVLDAGRVRGIAAVRQPPVGASHR